MNTQPTTTELTEHRIKTLKGVEIGLGTADPLVDVARKLEAQYPGHLILVQAGKFLHGFDRTAYALHVLKKYKLKLGGTTAAPHIRAGFPAGNFKRRLWPMVAEFGIPYVVALGTQQDGHTVYVGSHGTANAQVLESVSDEIVHQVIEDLRTRGELNKAGAQKLLANPDTAPFQLKAQAQDLDTQLLHDIIKLPRDVRSTWGENVRQCMARIMRGVFLYGQEDNKPQLLKQISADVDLLKHYIAQAPKLSQIKFAFEHRAGLAVELGRIVGGLIRAQQGARP